MNKRALQIAKRAELLELEAEMQRVALAATFAELGQKKTLAYAATLGSAAVHLLSIPRVRWLVMATLLAKLKKKKKDKDDND
jgi:hypothetical protein